jgi:hypothetical protein
LQISIAEHSILKIAAVIGSISDKIIEGNGAFLSKKSAGMHHVSVEIDHVRTLQVEHY